MTIERFDVLNRWTNAVQFTAEIEVTPDMTPRVKLGLAVRWGQRSGVYLSGADLSGAYLSGADLSGADLSGANLSGADLSIIKNDIWEILLRTTTEISGLKKSILIGKINGSAYEGECACLVGTIAKVKGCSHHSIPGLTPNSSRPAERWFLQFKKGQTPENYSPLKVTLDWIEEFETLIAVIHAQRA